MAIIGAVTDDFTGAASAGMMMAKTGVETGLFFDSDMVKDAKETSSLEAIYVSSNSRALAPEDAYKKVKQAVQVLKRCGVQYFSKKIDTTLRGGMGYEVDAMLDELGEDTMAIMVTAMPPSRRICVGGYSIIDSVILNETSVANDVKTPITESFVPAIIRKQTKHKVDSITIDVVQKDLETLKKSMERSKDHGNRVIVVDAVTMEHIAKIAKACVDLKWSVLAVDPGAFTMKLAVERGLANESKRRETTVIEPCKNKSVFIIAGSANPSTKQQMDILFEKEESIARISVSPRILLENNEKSIREIELSVKKINDLLCGKKPPKVILVETALHGEVLNLKEEDLKHGYKKGESSAYINAGLANIADMVLQSQQEKIAGLMLTGGDTMESVCRKIKTTYIKAIDNIVAQVDVGKLGGAYEGMPVVVKGGFCGYDTVGADIVERILIEANKF